MSMRRLPFALLLLLAAASVHSAPADEVPALGPTPLDRRLIKEREWLNSGLFMVPYKPNYFLFWTYNTNPNHGVYDDAGGVSVDKTESKFQISFKIPAGRGLFAGNGDLYFAYTQLSMWQVYNRENSAPFRDNNYEPELFLTFDTNFDVAGLNNRLISLGFVHQSNGQTYPLSRSWNRLYTAFVLQKARWIATFRPWYRIPDQDGLDDNPDIEKYMGYGDLRLAHAWRQGTISCLLRNNLRIPGNKGAIELGYSFPLNKILRGYVQYFNGYGESLLDYDHPNNRIGLGIALSDWI
jgi:phospholipase A1